MSLPEEFVSLHPYFNVHPGKLPDAKALLPAFVEKTRTEARMLFYGFTLNGEEVFCREAYDSAEGVLAHLSNVGDLLEAMLKIAELTRIEVHGPEAELAKLRGPLEDLKPAWFVQQRRATNDGV
jgi:hypothetical protein